MGYAAPMSTAPGVTCPNCAYALDGLQTLKCPECGYVPEPEEIAGETRRRVFWELTRFSQYSWLVIIAALSAFAFLLLEGMRTSIHLAAGLAVIAPVYLFLGYGAQTAVANRCPQAYRPLVRRLWRVGLLWLQLPWLLSGATFFVTLIGKRMWERFFPSPTGPNWWNWGDLSREEGFVALVVGGAVGTLIAPWLWHRRWKQLIRISGLPTRTAEQVGSGLPMRLTLLPGVFCFIAPGVIALVLQGLDWVFPGWWR